MKTISSDEKMSEVAAKVIQAIPTEPTAVKNMFCEPDADGNMHCEVTVKKPKEGKIYITVPKELIS